MKIYFISGLAADRSVFKYIQLPPGFEAVYLDWIEPLRDETLPQYALRLAQPIDVSKPFGLLGLSFGGMLAVEIAKHYNPLFTILLSSVASVKQLPPYYRFAGKLNLHRVLPISAIQHAAILKRFFTRESSEDKKLLKGLIEKSDARFIKWALHAILNWESNGDLKNSIHIHGTHDGILPHRFTTPTHAVRNGGHLMVLTRAGEINRILAEALAPYQPAS